MIEPSFRQNRDNYITSAQSKVKRRKKDAQALGKGYTERALGAETTGGNSPENQLVVGRDNHLEDRM